MPKADRTDGWWDGPERSICGVCWPEWANVRIRRHAWELGCLVAANVLSLALNVLIIKVLTGLGPAEYGRYALVASMNPLVSGLIFTPLDQFSQRYYFSYLHAGRLRYFRERLFKSVGIASAGLAGIGAALLTISVFKDGSAFAFWVAACVFVFGSTVGIPFLSLLNTMRRRGSVALFMVCEKAGQAAALILLVAIDALGAGAVLATLGIVGLAFSVARMGLVFRQIAPHFADADGASDFGRNLRAFGGPVAFFGLLTWFQTSSERWVIRGALSLEDVGSYALLTTISTTVISLCFGAVSQFIGPVIWARFADLHDRVQVHRGFYLIRLLMLAFAAATAVLALWLWLFGDFLVRILGGTAFMPAASLLPVVFVGAGMFYLGQGLNSVGFGLGNMKAYSLPKTVGALATVTCYAILAPIHGLAGVAAGAVVGSSIYVAHVLLVNTGMIALHEKRVAQHRV